MRNLYKSLIVLIILANFSCEDKFYKKKFDIHYLITNKTDTTIKQIRIDASDGLTKWIFKNVSPGETETLTFNIKRDVKVSEGSIVLTSFFSDSDSVFLGLSYFTNWYYLDSNPAKYNIYKDRIEEAK
ncbi:hypothetical protein SAMN05660293_03073 [Dyadobacter psychrophilus]|uniref:Uncharacterized protein n=1 Tax=Dyadobacter psychrophilus TaxID=651661 RepID=A0A1T5FDK5_9BACT|nr:hypothetical protein SAMN05660293_03073 [Dyadobacter psychrophilus]